MNKHDEELLKICEEECISLEALNKKTGNIPIVGRVNKDGITVLPSKWNKPEDDDL